jgi:hypothetical protein
MNLRLTIILSALIVAASSTTAASIGKCSFKPSLPVTLKSDDGRFGFCRFDPERLSYAGSPAEQAKCLLNPVQPVGRLGAPLKELPPVLAERVGKEVGLPERARLLAWLGRKGLRDPLGDTLAQTVAYSRGGDLSSRPATYFVIHDTSAPNYGSVPWPRNIDDDSKINNLNRYRCSNDIERAHVFINRGGAILLAHDFSVPWRATKFEMATNFDDALKGLFLHVELVQPRRRDPKFGRGNDFLAPQPGFSESQYEALAVVYAVASVRAGIWLIPAFHSVIDEGIRNKHDDPQNFELASFALSLQRLLAELAAPGLREAEN